METKVKVKVHVMKAYRESRYIAILILNLGTSRFGRFAPRKEPWYPFNTRSDGPQNRSGLFGEQQNLLSLLGFEPQTVQLLEIIKVRQRARSVMLRVLPNLLGLRKGDKRH